MVEDEVEDEVEDHFFNRGNEGIVVATAKALNESGIACVLWGRSCMRRWGHEYSKALVRILTRLIGVEGGVSCGGGGLLTLPQSVAFVVADEKVDQAMQCLLEKQPYTRQKVCVCDAPRDCDDWDQVCFDLPSKNHLHWEEGKWAKYYEARLEIFGRSELPRMIPMDALPSDYPNTASFAEAIKSDFCLISDSDLLPHEMIFSVSASGDLVSTQL